MSNNRSLLIFNPTMKSQEGHFYNYDTGIAIAAKPFFENIEIFADKSFVVPVNAPCKISPILNIIPISALKNITNKSFSLFRLFKKSKQVRHSNSSIIAEVPSRIINLGRWLNFIDITLGLRKVIARESVRNVESIDIFIEHAHIGEIYAVGYIVKRIKQLTSKPVTFHLVLRYTPDMMFPSASIDKKFMKVMNCLIRSIAPAIYFYTDSEQLTNEYRTLFLASSEEQFKTLPIPVLLKGEVQKSSSKDVKFCASLLGPPRLEKGFDRLPEIIESLRKITKLKLAVQISKNPIDPRIAERTVWLSQFPRDIFELELLEGPVPEETYFSWFAKTDILLLPYISPRYANSTSGVFVEALYFMAPIITLKDTWMAKKIAEAATNGLKIGEVAEDIKEFGTMAERIMSDMNRYRNDMQSYLAQWKQFHNSDVLVRMLVEK